jgi:uncharacterized protein
MFENGNEVSKDEMKVLKWYLKSAEQGNANAQCNLELMFNKGKGVSKDEMKVLKWYLKSAEQGNANA